MTSFAELLVGLIADLPIDEGDLVVSEVDLEIPVESRMSNRGLEAAWPRGRVATGFDPPLAMISMRIAVEST